jgi:alkylation response protein AidB-like acyl-CoA dehydrogenase
MHLAEPASIVALRAELRAYFARLLTPDVRARLADYSANAATVREVVRQMGTDGWLGIGWPAEYGGQGRGPAEQFVFFDEVNRASAPYPMVTLNTVGPTLMVHGTEEQKRRYLPGILAGEIHFAIGYTEPDAGTDLAALRTRATRDGDVYVVDGNKVFTTGAELADFVWLACRTDPTSKRHEGISILIVDCTDPGYSYTPIHTLAGTSTNVTFYDSIRVPVANLVGVEHQGWSLITSQLNHERVTLGANCGLAFELFAEVRQWATATVDGSGRRLVDVPWVQSELARAHARLEALRLMNWRMTWAAESGEPAAADSSMVKVFGTESVVDVYRILLGVLGDAGLLPAGQPGAALAGRLEKAGRQAQINTFGGGVNEVQRELIGARALGVGRRR